MKKKIIALLIVATMVLAGTSTIFAETTDANYLTFTAQEANSSVTFNYVNGENVQYNKNDGGWTTYAKGTPISLDKGDKVSFIGNNVRTDDDYHFVMTGKIAASGDVTSLTNGTGGDVNLTASCYEYMFKNCKSLISAPSLPSETLAEGCYMSMFSGCTGLETAPELPATTLTEFCYEYMFRDCTSLTTAPELPATTLAGRGCCDNMFRDCTNLEAAPSSLPATTLTDYCYRLMFYGCTGLTTAPELPATTLAESCYDGMFYCCTNLTEAPELPATTLTEYCYNEMFWGCTELKVCEGSATSTIIIKDCPSTDAHGCVGGMFAGTGGSYTADPVEGKTYYYIGHHTVSYDENGADSGTAPEDPKVYDTGDTATVLGNTGSLARDGYEFGGWNTKEDGTGTDYAEGDAFVITEDTILYAVWEDNRTVPVASDFTFTAPASLTYDGSAKEATVTGKEGMGAITVKYFDSNGKQLTSAPVDAGKYTVKIDVAESTAYQTASDLTASGWTFTIARADVTVTAKDVSKEYGAKDPALTAEVKGTIGTDTIEYTVSRLKGEDAGVYTIIPVGEVTQGNYFVSYISGTFTINPAKESAVPGTGDSGNAWLYIIIAVLALGAAAGAGVAMRRRTGR